MKQKILIGACCFVSAMTLAGCASDVIIFYPKADAAKAADTVIDDIFGIAPPQKNVTPANVNQETVKK